MLKEASKNPMYKSTTDQGKVINLFNLDFVRLQEIQYCLLRPYLACKKLIGQTKTCSVNEMEPTGGIGFA
jgi:endothelin-converting enzyme/putative endopeptidase